MSSLLAKLENNEAILLMYLHDELPAEDRVEVEQMLKIDANLRAELHQLSATQAGFCNAIQQADQHFQPPVSVATAQRQIGRLMQQWNTRRLLEAASQSETRQIRSVPRWVSSTAAAACIAVGLISWWVMHDPGTTSIPGDPPSDIVQEDRRSEMIALMRSFDNSDDLQEIDQQLQSISDVRSTLISIDGSPR